MATKKTESVIEIKPIQKKIANITIVGDTPLIVHSWSEKARRELEQKSTIGKKVARNMFAEACATLWWMDEDDNPLGHCDTDEQFDAWIERYKNFNEEDWVASVTGKRFGFPVTGIKDAGISAVYRNGESKDKVSLRSSFKILGETECQLGQIISDDIPSIREDMVKVGMGTADLRYRAQFTNWRMNLTIEYDVNGKLTLSEIVNLINKGGFYTGIGEWRMEKGGQYGAFHVATN